MKTTETSLKYKGIDYKVLYEKHGNEITITGIYYNGQDIGEVLDSLNFDYAVIDELILDEIHSMEYEKNYEL